MAAYRAARLAAEIQRLLSEMLQNDLQDPRLVLANVTRVEVSHDLQHAKVYVSTLDPEGREQAAEALRHARGFLRTRLAAQLTMRTTPDLQFVADSSIASGDQVLGIMRDLERQAEHHD